MGVICIKKFPTTYSVRPTVSALKIWSQHSSTLIAFLMWLSTFPYFSPDPRNAFYDIFVFTCPGYTWRMWIPSAITSHLNALPNPLKPNFEAQYKVLTGMLKKPATLFTFTIYPNFLYFIPTRAALVAATCESMFVFIIVSQTDNSILLNSPLIEMPPLLKRMSTCSVLKSSLSLRYTSLG